jgi:hypothetical protein
VPGELEFSKPIQLVRTELSIRAQVCHGWGLGLTSLVSEEGSFESVAKAPLSSCACDQTVDTN